VVLYGLSDIHIRCQPCRCRRLEAAPAGTVWEKPSRAVPVRHRVGSRIPSLWDEFAPSLQDLITQSADVAASLTAHKPTRRHVRAAPIVQSMASACHDLPPCWGAMNRARFPQRNRKKSRFIKSIQAITLLCNMTRALIPWSSYT
jgi:hypothetical protein